VYGEDDVSQTDAAYDAMQLSVERGNQVILAELAETTPDVVDLAAAAEAAYDAGVVVIAPDGNDLTLGPASPANARRVLAVGAYDADTGDWWDEQAWGQTTDGRVKPDLIAPSNSETAANAQGNLHNFGGTSGAAPYVAGAAYLVRNWMALNSEDPVDPGQVYAMLILSGDEVGPFGTGTKTGAGRVRLPGSGTCWWGKVWVSSAVRYVDVPIDVPSGTVRVEAALWWPESTAVVAGATVDTHNDVNLELWSPSRSLSGSSRSVDGVFERARVDAAAGLDAGQWHLRVKAETIRTGAQWVYWAASVLPEIPAAPVCPSPPPTP
jgi:hypothetical protein